MPELQDRSQFEKSLARSLGAVTAAQMERLTELLGDPPDPDRVDQAYWAQSRDEIAKGVTEALEQVFLASAMALMKDSGSWIDDLVKIEIQAGTWASGYAAKLASDLTTNTEKAFRQLIDRATRDGWDTEHLLSRLFGLYGVARLETIAITEVTRAQAEGERHLIGLLAASGGAMAIKLKPYHFTANDERVCPVCGARHGVEITDGIFAPLHPRCRCWTDWRLT